MKKPIQVLLTLIIAINSQSVFAEKTLDDSDSNTVVEKSETTNELSPIENKTGRQIRTNKKHNAVGGLSLLESWVPNKWMLTYGYNKTPDSTWELEYSRGSISFNFIIDDLGKVTEQRLSLLRRSYSGRDSFHFLYGLHYYNFKATLGDDLLGALPAAQYDLIEVSNIGLTWGLANRWQFKKDYSFTVDWISLYIPLFAKDSESAALAATSDPNDREDIEDILDLAESLPTFSILRLQLGYSF